MNIFLTNLSYHATNDIIKLIKNSEFNDAYIVGSSEYPYGYTSASTFVDKLIFQPALVPNNDYLNFIINTCKNYKIDILFAIDEDEIKLLSKYKKFIPAIFITPSPDVIEIFCNKKIANEHIAKLGINIPKYINSQKDLNGIISGKIISRKCISCASLGIKRYDIDESLDLNSIMNSDNIVQELINGVEYCVDVFCDKTGIPKIIVPRKRVAIRGGTTHKCLIERNERLISLSKRICSEYKLFGLSNMQFMIENGTDNIFFLEVNPRIGATTIATSLSSVNLIELFINHFLFGKELETYDYYMNKVKWGAFISRYYAETICVDYKDGKSTDKQDT